MRIPALVATILILVTGCDKQDPSLWWKTVTQRYTDFIDRVSGVADAARPPAPRFTDLAGKPPVLFQVFGKRSDPRMIPIAVREDDGRLGRIVLTGRGWREFDRLYASAGDTLTLYQDGRRVGTATVKQGMWQSGDSALYQLPACRLALPLATIALRGDVAGRNTVELLASNAPLGRTPEPVMMSPAQVERTAREIGLLVAARLSISPHTLDSLDFRAIAVPTGVPSRPTLVISYIDPAATDSTKNLTARQVLVLADQGPYGYGPTYWHFQRGRNPNPQFRRYVDHLDINGDGFDEIILEAWNAMRPGSFYIVLGRESGLWQERFRSTSEWCLDAQAAQIAAAEAAK